MLYYTELSPATSFQASSLHALLQAEIPAPLVLAPSVNQAGVWLGAGHTHWLLTVQGGNVALQSELRGVPLVGHSAVGSDVEWDVRIEAGTRELTVAYHRSGERGVGGAYTMNVDRGLPVMVSGKVRGISV